MRLSPLSLVLILASAACAPVRAQLLADTVFTWQGYGHPGQCRLRLYTAAASEEDRTHVFVLAEVAANRGPTTLTDARHLIELAARRYGVDPGAALWVFHWGAFSFEGAGGHKELFLRATVRRTAGGALGTPSWRLVTREDVEAYTDRLFQ